MHIFCIVRMASNSNLFHDILVKVRRQDSSYVEVRLGDFMLTIAVVQSNVI